MRRSTGLPCGAWRYSRTRMYRFVDHTAELEVELEAGTAEGVLLEALRAFAELAGHGDGEPVERAVDVSAGDLPALLAAWLEELVFLADSEQLVPEEGEIRSAALASRASCASPRSPTARQAVTLHRLPFRAENGCGGPSGAGCLVIRIDDRPGDQRRAGRHAVPPVFADEEILRGSRASRSSSSRTWRSPASSVRRSRCPTSTGLRLSSGRGVATEPRRRRLPTGSARHQLRRRLLASAVRSRARERRKRSSTDRGRPATGKARPS
jgi:SHS2 domain-containing protein